MLRVLICEDNQTCRTFVENIVNEYIITKDCDMKLALSTGSPTEILAHLEVSQVKGGLYILDVDLRAQINGIELGAKIREQDISATIIFITTHSELAPLVFRHKVEAMDYIIKDETDEEVKARTRECMQSAYERYLAGRSPKGKIFTIKIGDQRLNFPQEDILYFETDPSPSASKKIIIRTQTGKTEFRGALNELEKIGTEFYRCHASIVVNVNKIKCVNSTAREVEMLNGDYLPVSRRLMPGLLKLMK